MNKLQMLDCTLRDGGYCNQWKFGFENQKKIIQSLVEADIDIIECGFLTNTVEFHKDITKFTKLEQFSAIIPENRCGKLFVALMNYGEYDISQLPQYDGKSIDGIRVAFHKKDMKQALEVCSEIAAKGYKVFVQAMVSLSYSDEEFLSLIKEVNRISPYVFYIVDSFGMMKKKNLMRLFYLIENNLNQDIWIGFHSHNNMQLAYSNAQNLVEVQTSRGIIIDASIYGMGRGAGNLNTELFVEYLNENYGKKYVLKPILSVIDKILSGFYQSKSWGYSLPNYISAKHWSHPSYAIYLSEKNTLTVEAMDEIFSMLPDEKRFEFDKNLIEELYIRYLATGNVQDGHREELKKQFFCREIVLIAPGKSSEDEKEVIHQKLADDNVLAVSINFHYQHEKMDYLFVSNMRRFRDLPEDLYGRCIVTSNIPADRVYLQTKYFDLLMPMMPVRDNAGLMAIRFFKELGVSKIYLAGFDGYSHHDEENYVSHEMTYVTEHALTDAINAGMSTMLAQLKKEIDIEFLTQPRYVHISQFDQI